MDTDYCRLRGRKKRARQLTLCSDRVDRKRSYQTRSDTSRHRQHVLNRACASFSVRACQGTYFPPCFNTDITSPEKKKRGGGDDEKVIVAVQLRTFIYDKSGRNHHNRDLITAAWGNIGMEIGADGIFLHNNINYGQRIDGSLSLSS